MSRQIFIEPFDVLLFRESKPFSGGEDHLARSIFPPPPSTIYAAVRSFLLSLHFGRFDAFKEGRGVPPKLVREIGEPANFGTLELRRVVVGRRAERVELIEKSVRLESFYPIPSDVADISNQKAVRHLLLRPVENCPGYTNLPKGLQHLWIKRDVHGKKASGWVTEKGMARYLNDDAYSKDSFFGPGEIIAGGHVGELLFKREERTGIARDRNFRSAREGLLYSVEYLRLKPGVGFFAEFLGTDLLPESGLLNLGGDRRPARYQPGEVLDFPLERIKRKIEETAHFKLVLVTPALLGAGWRPKWIDPNSLSGVRGGVSLRLLAVALGRPVGIGGFDIVRQRPKPIHRFVPAGAVYFFEILRGKVDSVIREFHQRSISEDSPFFPETAKQGFGYSLVGGW